MNNTYLIEKNDIIEALDELDGFISSIDKFIETHSNYSYTAKIDKNEVNEIDKNVPKWIIELTVNKDE